MKVNYGYENTEIKEGDIIIFKDGENTYYDLICFDPVNGKFFSLDLNTCEAKSSRFEDAQDLAYCYKKVIEIAQNERCNIQIIK